MHASGADTPLFMIMAMQMCCPLKMKFVRTGTHTQTRVCDPAVSFRRVEAMDLRCGTKKLPLGWDLSDIRMRHMYDLLCLPRTIFPVHGSNSSNAMLHTACAPMFWQLDIIL